MNLTKRIVDTMTWNASSDLTLDLPTEGLITRIDLECYITMSGGVSGALASLGLWRFIQSLRIQGGGGKDYFSMSGVQMGTMLHYLNLLDFPGSTWKDLVATSQYIAFRLHFGSKPRDIYGRDNPFDLSVAIPAFAEKDLKLIWTTTAAADTIDGVVDISSGTIRATVHLVQGGEAVWPKMIPTSVSTSVDPGATKTDLSLVENVPIGAYVRRIVVMAHDDTAVGSNGPLVVGDQIDELGLKLVKDNRRLIHIRTRTMEVCGSPWFDGGIIVDTPNTLDAFSQPGLHTLDLRQYGDRDYGLDARGMNTGDLELAMTIGTYASGDIVRVWYDQVQPWSGR